MGLSPVLGGLTSPADDGRGVAPVMVLTYEFWMKHYRRRSVASSAGRCISTATGVTVIGVVQPAPWFPDHVDVLTNMVVSPHHLSAQMTGNRIHRMTEIIGRLEAGRHARAGENRSRVGGSTRRARIQGVV